MRGGLGAGDEAMVGAEVRVATAVLAGEAGVNAGATPALRARRDPVTFHRVVRIAERIHHVVDYPIADVESKPAVRHQLLDPPGSGTASSRPHF